jgi:hypothetical protein
MHVDEVEVVRVEHSAQPEDPPGVPGRDRPEAPDGTAARGLQAGSERGFAWQEVGDRRFDQGPIALFGVLDQEPFGTPRAESLDEVKNRKRRVK